MTALQLWATIDRFEMTEEGQELAVLVFDDGQQLVVPRTALPWARRGTVLRVTLEQDSEAEQERRSEIERLQRRLFGEAEP
ncbi:DUF3006 domain-containing protein [Thermomicrobium sp.]